MNLWKKKWSKFFHDLVVLTKSFIPNTLLTLRWLRFSLSLYFQILLLSTGLSICWQSHTPRSIWPSLPPWLALQISWLVLYYLIFYNTLFVFVLFLSCYISYLLFLSSKINSMLLKDKNYIGKYLISTLQLQIPHSVSFTTQTLFMSITPSFRKWEAFTWKLKRIPDWWCSVYND